MAAGHPYGTAEQLRETLGREKIAKLAQLPGTNPDTVLTSVGLDASRIIDVALSGKWPTPFEAHPGTPGVINTVWKHYALYLLFATRFADSTTARAYLDLYRTELAALLAPGAVIDTGVDPIPPVPANQGTIGLAYRSTSPVFAGRDSEGRSRTRRW